MIRQVIPVLQAFARVVLEEDVCFHPVQFMYLVTVLQFEVGSALWGRPQHGSSHSWACHLWFWWLWLALWRIDAFCCHYHGA